MHVIAHESASLLEAVDESATADLRQSMGLTLTSTLESCTNGDSAECQGQRHHLCPWSTTAGRASPRHLRARGTRAREKPPHHLGEGVSLFRGGSATVLEPCPVSTAGGLVASRDPSSAEASASHSGVHGAATCPATALDGGDAGRGRAPVPQRGDAAAGRACSGREQAAALGSFARARGRDPSPVSFPGTGAGDGPPL